MVVTWELFLDASSWRPSHQRIRLLTQWQSAGDYLCVALQRGTLERDGLFQALQLALVQSAAAASPVWLPIIGAQNPIFSDIAKPPCGQLDLHAARAEAMLPIFCVDVTLGLNNDSLAKIARSGSIANASEPEVRHVATQRVPRLTYAPQMLPGQVSLGFLRVAL